MKKFKFFSSFVLLLGLVTGCNNSLTDDGQSLALDQNTEQNNVVQIGTQVASNMEALGDVPFQGATRTSLSGQFPNSGYNTVKFYWTWGDVLHVSKNLQNSSIGIMTKISDDRTTAQFRFRGVTLDSTKTVFYLGTNGRGPNIVSIASTQTQDLPDNSLHIGAAGDCGVANVVGDYSSLPINFMLNHKATYICFMPYNSDTTTPTKKLLAITIEDRDGDALSPIAGEFTIDSSGKLTPVTSMTSNKITLNVGGTQGFTIPKGTFSQASDASYMVIAPGSHALIVTYKLNVENTNGTITTTTVSYNLDTKTFKPNTVYTHAYNPGTVIPSDNPLILSMAPHMWDAQVPINFNAKWNKDEFLQKGNTIYNTEPTLDASHLDKYNPSLQDVYWYMSDGDVHWDKDQHWLIRSDVDYKLEGWGGIWVKQRYLVNPTPAPSSMPTLQPGTTNIYIKNIVKLGKPVNDSLYFFVPANGRYVAGDKFSSWRPILIDQSIFGHYWLRSNISADETYRFYFGRDAIYLEFNALKYRNACFSWTDPSYLTYLESLNAP